MVEIKMMDETWMQDTINSLLASKEGITDLEKAVCNEKGYKELNQMIRMIEEMAAGTPTEAILMEYRDALEQKAGYEYTAAQLNGIKEGFRLAMFLKPDGKMIPAAGRGKVDG